MILQRFMSHVLGHDRDILVGVGDRGSEAFEIMS